MDFKLTKEQKTLQQTVREFVTRELIPLEQQILNNESKGLLGIEREQIRQLQLKAKEIGIWGIDTAEQYGGQNLGAVMAAVINMELGRTIVPFTFGGSADNILYLCNEQQKQKYLLPVINGERCSCFALSEPESGSDIANLRTSAVKDGDGWVLNGEKIFISFGDIADFAIVFAVTDKEKGATGGITCFLVDREFGWRSEPIPTMGGDTYPATLIFENVRVPMENVLGEVGQGFTMAMKWIGKGRWLFPARGVGAAERLLQMAIDYSKQRVIFGEPIAERQGIQWMIADSAVEIEATKWMILHAAWMADQGLDTRHQASMVKLYGTNMANRVVDRVLQIHGSMGYTKKLPIERWYRDMRVWRIFEGTDEIQRIIIARNLLKGHVKLGEWE